MCKHVFVKENADGHVLALCAAAIRLEFFSVGGGYAEFDGQFRRVSHRPSL